MKTSWILSTIAVAAGYMTVAGALAAPPAGSGIAPARADLIHVQVVSSRETPADRLARLRQHRSILESALQPPVSAGPAETLEPQARALQRPEPMIVTAPQDPPVTQEPDGEELMSCEAAAQIVADFGFSDIGSQQCSGDLYRFSAMRDGTAYAIGIRAATGEIAEVSRQ